MLNGLKALALSIVIAATPNAPTETKTLCLGNQIYQVIIPPQKDMQAVRTYLNGFLNANKDRVVHQEWVTEVSLHNYERLNSLKVNRVGNLMTITVTPQDVIAYWNNYWFYFESLCDQEAALLEIDKIKSQYDADIVELTIVEKVVIEYLDYIQYPDYSQYPKIINQAKQTYTTLYLGNDTLCFMP